MQKNFLTVFLLALGLLVTSCSGGDSSNTETPSQETVDNSQTTNPNSPTPNPQESSTQATNENNTVASNDLIKSTPLIESTKPEKRLDQIRKQRSNPFSAIEINPKFENIPPSGIIPPPNPNTSIPSPQGNNNGNDFNPNSEGNPNNPENIELEPVLAREVKITGIIDLGNKTQIIVNAPQEEFARYVETGQYLSNGQVLVKRIETQIDGSKLVVLEQFGKEVVKTLETTSS